MQLFGGLISISNISTLLLVIFSVLLVGYLLGRITIKGISLGDAGVFIVALLCGALFFGVNDAGMLVFDASSKPYDFSTGLSMVESLGLILFVTSVGYIAGPKFFGNFKKNFKSYVLLGVIIILAGGLAAVGCIYLGELIGYGSSIETQDGFVAMIVGLLSGSLTSTPAFSAAKATVAEEYTGLVSVGHGIAYIFGVIGVVLFVQIIPKLTKANMEEERAKLSSARGLGGMFGSMIPSIFFPIIITAFSKNPQLGYGLGVTICAAVGFVLCLLSSSYVGASDTFPSLNEPATS